MVLLLAGGSGYTRKAGLRRLKERLEKVPGASNVRYEPSAIKPRSVTVDIDAEIFFERTLPQSQGRLEVFWQPREETDVQRVQWVDDTVSLGWHKDDDHPDLGTTHFQREAGDEDEPHREAAHIEVKAPLSFLEVCLDRLQDRLGEDAH